MFLLPAGTVPCQAPCHTGYPALVMVPVGSVVQWPCMSSQMVPADAFTAPAQFSMETQGISAEAAEPEEEHCTLLTCGGVPCSSKSAMSVPSPLVDLDSLPSPSLLIHSAALSDLVSQQLESCDHARLGLILGWLKRSAVELALSACGCHVMQKAFEVAGGDDRAALVDQLRGHAVKLVDSPHGNHVLQKCIETLPTNNVQFVVDELAAYHGGWAALARHRFGCRVEERLIEQLPEEMIGLLMTAVIADTHTLCCHPFGNYVVQHVLEYGSKEKRGQIVAVLTQEDIVSLAQHKIASNVVAKVVELCGPEEQQALARAILAVRGGWLAMGCSRYGSSTARRLFEVLPGALRGEAMRQLSDSIGRLRSSKYGRGLAQRLQVGGHGKHEPFEV